MNCGCATYECIDVYLVECAGNITLPIISDQTGTWKMILRFNGTAKRTDINVISGQPVVIPNNLNESYSHTVVFYKPDGTIFNDTCYIIKTMATVFTNPAPEATTVTTSLVIQPDEDGNIIQSDELKNVIVHDVVTINDAVYSMVKNKLVYNAASGTIDLTNIGGYQAFDPNTDQGSTITILYEKA